LGKVVYLEPDLALTDIMKTVDGREVESLSILVSTTSLHCVR